MILHLTEEQILAWQMNEQTPQDREHVQECDRCRAQVARLESSIALFRASVQGWGEKHELSRRQAKWIAPSSWQMRRRATLQWVSAAALTLAVAVPVYTHRVIEERREVQAQQRAQADQALLEQVDQEVSQTVPDTLEPLTDLVQWEASETGESESSTQTRRTQ